MRPVRLADGAGRRRARRSSSTRTTATSPSTRASAIRPRSALGLKYVELDARRPAQKAFRDGDTMPASQASLPDRARRRLQDVRRARPARHRRRTCRASATRSPAAASDLGRTLEELPRFFEHLEPVMRNAVGPGHRARAASFKRARRRRPRRGAGLQAARRAVHRRWPTRSRRSAATRRRSRTRSRSRRRRWTRRSRLPRPAAVPRPTSTASRTRLSPARPRELRARAADRSTSAIKVGTRCSSARRSSTTSCARRSTRSASSPSSRAPTPRCAGSTATVDTLNPQLRFYGPYVTVCNCWNYFFTYLGRALLRARPDRHRAARAAQLRRRQQDDGVGSIGRRRARPTARTPTGRRRSSSTHQPYGARDRRQGNADCEAGQRGYPSATPRSLAPSSTASTVDPRTPRRAGPDVHRPRRTCRRARRSPRASTPAPYARHARRPRRADERLRGASKHAQRPRSR